MSEIKILQTTSAEVMENLYNELGKHYLIFATQTHVTWTGELMIYTYTIWHNGLKNKGAE